MRKSSGSPFCGEREKGASRGLSVKWLLIAPGLPAAPPASWRSGVLGAREASARARGAGLDRSCDGGVTRVRWGPGRYFMGRRSFPSVD
jgi:hypothetical protein